MRICLILLGCLATPAIAATCSQAAMQGSAPPAWQTYCWLDLASYNDATARTAAGQNFSYLLSDGATLTFTVRTTSTSPAMVAIAAPSWSGAAVGNTAFLGIPGRPIIYQQAGGTTTITFSNILITPPPGAPAVTAYAFVAADAESTNNGESLSFTTNGSGWQILDSVDPISGTQFPAYSGVGTATFTETGISGTVGGYIVASNSPTQVTTTLVGGGLQGAMFAVRFASLRLSKVLGGGRVDPADQFKFDINATSSGTNLGTGTTTGTGPGPFPAAAVSLASGIPLTITESMAAGSVSTLAKYTSKLNCINSTIGSSTVMPSNVTTTSYSFGSLQFGDAVQCTFTNTALPHMRIQKLLGPGGRFLAGDQFTVRIRAGTTTTATTTTTGTGTTILNGTTAMTQVTAGTAYTFSELAAGTTNLTQYTATMLCSNSWTSSPTTLPTSAPATITPVAGDVITCTVTNTKKTGNAVLTVLKSSTVLSNSINGTTAPKAIPGAVIRYSISVSNSGTLGVDTTTLEIIDAIPANLTYNNGVAATFVDGTPVSGLSFNATNDVRFSNATTGSPANFAACTYTPTAGFDTNIKYICVRPTGGLAAAGPTGQPSFSVQFQARVN